MPEEWGSLMPSRQKLDAVDLAIMWDRLVTITDEGAAVLIRSSFSTLVREGFDLSVLIFDANGEMIAQSTKCIPVFIGTASTTLSHMLQKYSPGELSPNDIIVSNDPMFGTGHMFDIAVMRPIFFNSALIGYAMSITHLPDIGGMGFSASATEIYHEGLRIPVWKLFRAGELDANLVELIRLNVRVADQVMGDIFANVSCVEVVATKTVSFLEEYSLESLSDLSTAILTSSDLAVRTALLELPDSVYRSEADVEAFGETRHLVCNIEKQGDRIHIDFEGTGPCVKAGINVPFPYTRAMALYAIKCVTSPTIANNDGATRAITLSAPRGCILNAIPPVASAGRHAIGHFVVPLVFEALANVVPDRVTAASGLMDILTFQGREASGREMSATYFIAGGFGAQKGLDGRPTLPGSSNMGATPIEIFEPLSELLVESKTLRPNSGGSGEYRGGPGQTVVLRNDSGRDITVHSMANRTIFPAQGLFGGGAGALREHWLNDRKITGQGSIVLSHGSYLRLEQAGGGGYGDPKKRRSEAIHSDIQRGFMTAEEAHRIYGSTYS